MVEAAGWMRMPADPDRQPVKLHRRRETHITAKRFHPRAQCCPPPGGLRWVRFAPTHL